MQNINIAQDTHVVRHRTFLWSQQSILTTRQHRARQFPMTGRPHTSPTGAKASGRRMEVRSKGCRVVWSKVIGKEHLALEGRDGKMVGTHQIESSSA